MERSRTVVLRAPGLLLTLLLLSGTTLAHAAGSLVDSSGSPLGAGALFGLIATPPGIYFVDDDANTFNLLH